MVKLRRLLRQRAPNVDGLVNDADYVSLVRAARYQDVVEVGDNELADLGVPVREAAVLALGDLEDIGHYAIADALADPFDEVRLAAVEALRRRSEFEVLCTALASWSPAAGGRARGAAIEALFALRAKGSSLCLTTAVLMNPEHNSSAGGDGALVRAMLETEAQEGAWIEVVAHLIEALSVPDSVIRSRAENLLVTLAPASVERLIEELARGSARARAASTLGAIKDQRAVEPLIASLEEPDAAVRAAACQALGELQDPVAVVPLMRRTRDGEHAVRAAAGAALDRLGSIALIFGLAAVVGPTLGEGEGEGDGDGDGIEQRSLTGSSAEGIEAEEADLVILASRLLNRAAR